MTFTRICWFTQLLFWRRKKMLSVRWLLTSSIIHRGSTDSLPRITCGRHRCTSSLSQTKAMNVTADRRKLKLAFRSLCTSNLRGTPGVRAMAPDRTVGCSFTLDSSMLMCTMHCPVSARASQKLFHCHVANDCGRNSGVPKSRVRAQK